MLGKEESIDDHARTRTLIPFLRTGASSPQTCAGMHMWGCASMTERMGCCKYHSSCARAAFAQKLVAEPGLPRKTR
eukprot:5979025-Alexandrium_andersonii.AAC.1